MDLYKLEELNKFHGQELLVRNQRIYIRFVYQAHFAAVVLELSGDSWAKQFEGFPNILYRIQHIALALDLIDGRSERFVPSDYHNGIICRVAFNKDMRVVGIGHILDDSFVNFDDKCPYK